MHPKENRLKPQLRSSCGVEALAGDAVNPPVRQGDLPDGFATCLSSWYERPSGSPRLSGQGYVRQGTHRFLDGLGRVGVILQLAVQIGLVGG
jgi:hypothetical protein